jgi:hypothetical protein
VTDSQAAKASSECHFKQSFVTAKVGVGFEMPIGTQFVASPYSPSSKLEKYNAVRLVPAGNLFCVPVFGTALIPVSGTKVSTGAA